MTLLIQPQECVAISDLVSLFPDRPKHTTVINLIDLLEDYYHPQEPGILTEWGATNYIGVNSHGDICIYADPSFFLDLQEPIKQNVIDKDEMVFRFGSLI
jgi:hypothetical protein